MPLLKNDSNYKIAAFADLFRVFSVILYKSPEQISCITQHLYLGSISEVISRKKKLGNYNVCCCFSTGLVLFCFLLLLMWSSWDDWNVQEHPNTQKNKVQKQFYYRTSGGKKNARLVIFPNSSCHEIENAFWFIEQIGGSEFQKFRFPHKGSIMAKQVLCWEFWPGATLLINTSVEFSWI